VGTGGAVGIILRHKIMKKTIALTLLFFLLPVALCAQLKVGVTAGLNVSKFTVSDNTYKEYIDQVRPGLLVGPTAVFTVPKTGLAFDASVLYDLRAAASKNNKNSKTIYCGSFQLPVNVRYGMTFGDIVHAFLFTGPQLGVNVGSKESLIISGVGRTTRHAMERRWCKESTTFSWNFGVGAVIEETFQVRISYNLAMRKSAEIRQFDLVTDTSTLLTKGKASALQVSLSYLF
jgi:hypothetical protein